MSRSDAWRGVCGVAAEEDDLPAVGPGARAGSRRADIAGIVAELMLDELVWARLCEIRDRALGRAANSKAAPSGDKALESDVLVYCEHAWP